MKLTRHHGWPLGILGALILITSLLTLLFYISRTSHPVEMDTMFMSDYQAVNTGYDEIVASREAFDKLFDAEIITHQHSAEPIVLNHVQWGDIAYDHALTIGTNRFYVTLTDKAGNPVKDAQLEALVTRYDTTAKDVTPAVRYDETQNNYHFGPFETIREGRYKIFVRITADGKIGHLEKSVFAR